MCKDFRRDAERKWYERVTCYTKAILDTSWMPSHDFDHHQRVWGNAVKLTRQISQSLEAVFYDQLLIACFFHDLGLVNDRSEKHGKESRNYCEIFLKENSSLINFDIFPMLEAIEHHDDKEYASEDSGLLYNILSMADDLDAFGAIGVFRYIEIYLIRSVPVAEIPRKILLNAQSRYKNLEQVCNRLSITTNSYHDSYNSLVFLLSTDSFVETPVTLVEWLQKNYIINRLNPFDRALTNQPKANKNKRVAAFVNSFRSEITPVSKLKDNDTK